MTPGAGTPWRKTVSFNNDMIENEKSWKSDFRLKIPDKDQDNSLEPLRNSILNQNQNQKIQKTKLTMQFESAREQKKVNETRSYQDSSEETPFSSPTRKADRRSCLESESQLPRTESHETFLGLNENIEACSHDDGDATTDLNKPLSESGKYWKSEFEKYQHEARLEIRKLLAYKEHAKSYAKLQDEKLNSLMEKLKMEQRKVIFMEESMSKYPAKIDKTSKEILKTEEESSKLVKELARQTTRAVHYKKLVAQFQKLARHIELNLDINNRKINRDSSSSDTEYKSDDETSSSFPAKKKEITELMRKLHGLCSLETENKKLFELTQQKDKMISKLKSEKEELIQQILSSKSQLERQDKDTLSQEEYYKNVTQAHQILQANCEASTSKKLQRSTETERMLRKMNNEKTGLNGLAHLKGSEANSNETQKYLGEKMSRNFSQAKSSEMNEQAVNSSQPREFLNNTSQHDVGVTNSHKILPDSSAYDHGIIDAHNCRFSRLERDSDRLNGSLPSDRAISEFPGQLHGPSSYHGEPAEKIKYRNTHDELQKTRDLTKKNSLDVNQNAENILSNPVTYNSHKSTIDILDVESRRKGVDSQNPTVSRTFGAHRNYNSAMGTTESHPLESNLNPKKYERISEGPSDYNRPYNNKGNKPRISLPPERIEAAKKRLAAKRKQNLNLAGSVSLSKA